MDVYRTPDEQFEALSGYAFAPHYLEQDGLRMHYIEEGAGDPVLLIPGMSYNRDRVRKETRCGTP